MQVKCVLFLIYCAVNMTDSQEDCKYGGLNNVEAYCTPSYTNWTVDYVPRIAHRITEIDLAEQPLKQLPSNAFQNITSQNDLVNIFLDFCQIQYIDVDAFMNLSSLEYLDISNNSISHFETGTFQHIRQLKELFVHYNKINRLQTGLFHNLLHLEEVDFRGNNIMSIANGAFRNTPSLVYICVEDNQLECLSPLFTDKFVNITWLFVHGNPWNCDCNLKGFYEEMKVRNQTRYKRLIICHNPPALRSRKVLDLTSDAFKCDAPNVPAN